MAFCFIHISSDGLQVNLQICFRHDCVWKVPTFLLFLVFQGMKPSPSHAYSKFFLTIDLIVTKRYLGPGSSEKSNIKKFHFPY